MFSLLKNIVEFFTPRKYIMPKIGDKIFITKTCKAYYFLLEYDLQVGSEFDIINISEVNGRLFIAVKGTRQEIFILYYKESRDKWDTIENIRNKKLEKLLC